MSCNQNLTCRHAYVILGTASSSPTGRVSSFSQVIELLEARCHYAYCLPQNAHQMGQGPSQPAIMGSFERREDILFAVPNHGPMKPQSAEILRAASVACRRTT